MHFVDRWFLSVALVCVVGLLIAFAWPHYGIADWLTALFYSLGVNQLRLTLLRR